MEAQTVQEFNGETGKWDTVPPDTAAPVEETTPVVAPADTDADDDAQPPVAAKSDAPADAKADKAAKPRNDPQARIDQAIARQREAERKAADLEKKAADLERRLAPAAEPVAPTADKFPDYATHLQTHPEATLEQWLDARDDWRDAKQTERVQTQQLEHAFTTLAQTFSATYAKAIEADATLPERVDPALLSVRPYSKLTAADKQTIRSLPKAEQDAVAFRCFLADQWLDSEHPVEVLEYLSDPKTFQRLATLPPLQVTRDLARFEARLGAAHPSTGSAPKADPIAKSATAAPIKPVGSSPHVPDDAPSDDDSDEEWRRKEDAREMRKRHRG